MDKNLKSTLLAVTYGIILFTALIHFFTYALILGIVGQQIAHQTALQCIPVCEYSASPPRGCCSVHTKWTDETFSPAL